MKCQSIRITYSLSMQHPTERTLMIHFETEYQNLGKIFLISKNAVLVNILFLSIQYAKQGLTLSH